MKVLHAWDLRIGQGFPEYPTLAERLREHLFEILRNLLARAAHEGASAIILGGNTLADNRITDHELLQLRDLLAASAAPVFILPGPLDPFTTDSPYRHSRELWKPPVTVLADQKPHQLPGLTLYPYPVTTRDGFSAPTPSSDSPAQPPPTAASQGLRVAVAYCPVPTAPSLRGTVPDSANFDYVTCGQETSAAEMLPGRLPAGARIVTFRRGAAPRLDSLVLGRFREVVIQQQLGDLRSLGEALEQLAHPADTILHLDLFGTLALDRVDGLCELIEGWRRKLLHLDLVEHFSIDALGPSTVAHPLLRATIQGLLERVAVPTSTLANDLPDDSEAARTALQRLFQLLRTSPHQDFLPQWK